ncbi:MAG: hypothetical protein RIR12_2650 [Bacteroidota bacterium]|jgi:hypothetical protein
MLRLQRSIGQQAVKSKALAKTAGALSPLSLVCSLNSVGKIKIIG